MKIIFLNAWDARTKGDIREYLKEQKATTDVFCFQEAYDNLQAMAAEVLSDYAPYFAAKVANEHDKPAQATYVRKGITVLSSGSALQDQPDSGLDIYTEVQAGSSSVVICNVHGVSRPVEKLDNPVRLAQSKALIDFYKDKQRVIIGGDLNLLPEADSIKTFARHDYHDLIAEFQIPTTRNQIAWDQYADYPRQYHSDYVFLSPDIRLESFAVPDNRVSDHLPMEVVISD